MFRFRNQLCISFSGTSRTDGRLVVNILYVVLNPTDYSVAAQYVMDYPDRRAWEKNWGFFDHDGELMAVYDIAPRHKVLRVEGYKAELWGETDVPPELVQAVGLPRGGAPPIRVGDEYWCFYHGVVKLGRHRQYGMGLYCFEARPPFRITRYSPAPLLWADEQDRWGDAHPGVIWPGGAILKGDVWQVGMGYQDRWQEVACYQHAQLEKSLVTV